MALSKLHQARGIAQHFSHWKQQGTGVLKRGFTQAVYCLHFQMAKATSTTTTVTFKCVVKGYHESRPWMPFWYIRRRYFYCWFSLTSYQNSRALKNRFQFQNVYGIVESLKLHRETTHLGRDLGQIFQRKSISFKSYRRTSIGHPDLLHRILPNTMEWY